MAQLACDLAIVKPICFTIFWYKSGCFKHKQQFDSTILLGHVCWGVFTCDEMVLLYVVPFFGRASKPISATRSKKHLSHSLAHVWECVRWDWCSHMHELHAEARHEQWVRTVMRRLYVRSTDSVRHVPTYVPVPYAHALHMTRYEYVTVVQIQAWVYATRRLYDIRTLRKSSRRLPSSRLPHKNLPSSSPSPLSSYPPLSSTVWFFSLSSFLFPPAVHCIFLFCTIAYFSSAQLQPQSSLKLCSIGLKCFTTIKPSSLIFLPQLFLLQNHDFTLTITLKNYFRHHSLAAATCPSSIYANFTLVGFDWFCIW